MSKASYTIWKFELSEAEQQTVFMPKGARVLTSQTQPDPITGQVRICLWAVVDRKAPGIKRKVFIVGTGRDMPKMVVEYAGTVQTGPYVWHVFIGEEA